MTQSKEPYEQEVTTEPRSGSGRLVSIESQTEFDLLSGRREQRTFLKMYVEARTSGLLAAISDRDWKTLCTLATYMDADGYCFPSQAELAKAIGCSRQMANERVNSLSRFSFKGQPVLLIVKGNRSGKGEWGRNGYRVLPIASLGIFTRDGQLAGSPEGRAETVSRALDTGAPSTPTVSSPTVTVPLDTNKNHVSNKNHLSNIRRAAQAVDNSEPPRSGQTNTGEHASDPRARPTRLALSEPDSLTKRQTSTTDQHALVRTPARGEADIAPVAPLHARSDGQNNGPELLGAILGRHSLRPEQQDAREAIESYIKDIAQAFGDKAKLKSSVTRAYNLYEQSGRTLHGFVDALFVTRANVKERHESTTQEPIQNRMSYFFRVLADQLGLKADGQAHRRGESATGAGSKSPQSLSPPE